MGKKVKEKIPRHGLVRKKEFELSNRQIIV